MGVMTNLQQENSKELRISNTLKQQKEEDRKRKEAEKRQLEKKQNELLEAFDSYFYINGIESQYYFYKISTRTGIIGNLASNNKERIYLNNIYDKELRKTISTYNNNEKSLKYEVEQQEETYREQQEKIIIQSMEYAYKRSRLRPKLKIHFNPLKPLWFGFKISILIIFIPLMIIYQITKVANKQPRRR